MRDYRRKQVRGLVMDVVKMQAVPCRVDVQMTSDHRGQTLSLSAANVLISIPLEKVTDIIKVVEK